jgi:pyruvate dehydrogenase E2 component (dihydrolipoamide acetyltransferase)
MAKDYVMPKLAMAMNEGTVNEWLVKEGEYVEQGDPIAVVETEKVSYDVESPVSGYLHIIVAAGETVPVEVTIAQFAATEEECAALNVSGGATASSPSQAEVESEQVIEHAAATPPSPAIAGRFQTLGCQKPSHQADFHVLQTPQTLQPENMVL